MFCAKCGRMMEDNNKECPYCGYKDGDVIAQADGFHIDHKSFEHTSAENALAEHSVENQKSRLTAGLLQMFLGAFGIGRFYMGDVWIAVGQIAATVFSCGIAGFIWGVVDGVTILNGSAKM